MFFQISKREFQRENYKERIAKIEILLLRCCSLSIIFLILFFCILLEINNENLVLWTSSGHKLDVADARFYPSLGTGIDEQCQRFVYV